MTTLELTIPDVKNTMKFLYDNPSTAHIPVMIVGESGIGKSEIVHQIAEENGWECVEIRLAGLLAEDMRGIPQVETWADIHSKKELTGIYSGEKPGIVFRLISSLKHVFGSDGPGILFFDEVNRAQPDVLQAIFQLLGQRKIDDNHLADSWHIAAAINPSESGNYIVNQLDPAFKRRTMIIHAKADYHGFINYAKEAEYNKETIRFLLENSEYFNKRINDDITLCPAVWERISKITHSISNRKKLKTIGESILKVQMGLTAGAEYVQFLKKTIKEEYVAKDIIDSYSTDKDLQNWIKQLRKDGENNKLSKLTTELTVQANKVDLNILMFLNDLPNDTSVQGIKSMSELPVDLDTEQKKKLYANVVKRARVA
jgi:ATP-dependent Clp protease ATP-binding subunit ClpA